MEFLINNWETCNRPSVITTSCMKMICYAKLTYFKMNKGGKFLKKLWYCAYLGEYKN